MHRTQRNALVCAALIAASGAGLGLCLEQAVTAEQPRVIHRVRPLEHGLPKPNSDVFGVRTTEPVTLSTKTAAVDATGAEAGRRSLELLDRLALGSAEGDVSLTVEAILALEAEACRLRHTASWLDKLGQTRAPAVTAAAARYLEDDDPMVRQAAVQALSGMTGTDVRGHLADRALEDSSAAVRAIAAGALARAADGDALASLSKVIDEDAAAVVRMSVVAGLGERAGDPEARLLLARIARSDDMEIVRELARDALES